MDTIELEIPDQNIDIEGKQRAKVGNVSRQIHM